MRPFLLAFIATDLTLALALALVYGGLGGDCVPPSIWCRAPGVACVLVCSKAWPQFPSLFAAGIAFGLLPGALSGTVLWRVSTRRQTRALGYRLAKNLPAGAAGVLSAGLVIILVLPGLYPILVGLTMILSFALWVVVIESVIFLDTRRLRVQGK